MGFLYFCRNQVRLRGLRLQGWRQSRCLLHWWPHPRLQLEPHQQHHLQHVRWSPRKEQEDDHHRWDVPHLQDCQGLQGHRWHPRFRWNLEIVRQERGQNHPQQGSLQAVDQSWYVVFVIFICMYLVRGCGWAEWGSSAHAMFWYDIFFKSGNRRWNIFLLVAWEIH